jgi:CheY-like chemotaxis protein
MSGDKERYLGMGMDGYLSKPIAERDLITEITRVSSLTPEQLKANRDAKLAEKAA